MTDVNPVPNPAPSGAPGQPTPAPSGGSPAPTDGPKYATEEQLGKVLERLDAQSRILAGLEKGKPAPAPAPDPKPTPKEPDPALAERVKAVEERETKQREVMRRNSVKAAALTKGIPDKHADRFARIVLAEHGDKVFVDEEYNVHYRDSETKTTPITDWVGAYLQTEDGQVFKPVKQAPNSDALRGGNETPPAASEFDGLTYKQVMSDPAKVARAVKVPGLMDKLRAAQK